WRADGAGEPQVAHDHAGGRVVVVGLEIEDLAGREGERVLGAEAHGLGGGRPVVPDRRPPRREQLEQPDGLEEAEPVRLEEEPLRQSRICSPARGGHWLTSSSSGGMRATRWVKELIET